MAIVMCQLKNLICKTKTNIFTGNFKMFLQFHKTFQKLELQRLLVQIFLMADPNHGTFICVSSFCRITEIAYSFKTYIFKTSGSPSTLNNASLVPKSSPANLHILRVSSSSLHLLYISTSIWVLRTPNAGQNSLILQNAYKILVNSSYNTLLKLSLQKKMFDHSKHNQFISGQNKLT